MLAEVYIFSKNHPPLSSKIFFPQYIRNLLRSFLFSSLGKLMIFWVKKYKKRLPVVVIFNIFFPKTLNY